MILKADSRSPRSGPLSWVPQLCSALIGESGVWRAGMYPFLGGGVYLGGVFPLVSRLRPG